MTEKYFVGLPAYLGGMAGLEALMDLRKLRYFLAVAETGSLTVAAIRLLLLKATGFGMEESRIIG